MLLQHLHSDILSKVIQVDLVSIISLNRSNKLLLCLLQWDLLLELRIWVLHNLMLVHVYWLGVVDLDVVGLVYHAATM